MSDNDALGSEGPLLLSHKSNMHLQGRVAELTKVKKDCVLFPLHLKICMRSSSSWLNIVYCKVRKVAGLTAPLLPQRAVAPPVHGGSVLPARLPQGQVVLVIRGDPRRTQHGPNIQAQREENTHQTHQLQGRQRRHAHFLRSAHG